MRRAIQILELVLLVTAILPCATSLSAGDTPSQTVTWQRPDLYDRGRQAYQNEDYVTALEDLYAFREINKSDLKPSSFQIQLDAVIQSCEDKLNAAIQVIGRDILRRGG
jgi:outer membrane protein assembly factor BamD (BamD/ComL family)